jgi:hypothetical protein
MGYLRSLTAYLRKFILIGWALAVVWIYLGNLVNFHQYHIWGKQLIPVACSSTRAKEEDTSSFVKNDGNLKLSYSGHQFDFTTPNQLVSEIYYPDIFTLPSIVIDTHFIQQGIQALLLRGPPTA